MERHPEPNLAGLVQQRCRLPAEQRERVATSELSIELPPKLTLLAGNLDTTSMMLTRRGRTEFRRRHKDRESASA